ncbi:DUF748 domain-containing protein [Mesonia sp. MT50]|uniref:DUF748 domain-containing protein n=1 Tax=Mesonia profundi TaxID=3070998 RepID=A0ABU1A2L9_9FLAO|nr:DUF748 domain-containing protein [Mesonia profundi]MDQ7917094.1 DUF748 domain-containing protein [Mesonia profundi]
MSKRQHRKRYKKKRYILPVILIVLLIAFRLYLPTLVKNNLNKVLADIPGYHGAIEDVDLSLWRGAYQLEGLYLNKKTAKSEVPFLNFPMTDISIEWRSLFKGKIVTEIEMHNPEIIYVLEDQEETPEEGEADTEDWTAALTDIVPLDINSFDIYNGKLAFVQLESEPNIDLSIHNLRLSAKNLRNVKQVEKVLPSPITATGTSIGNGKLNLDGKINLIKEIPDMDMSLSLDEVDATALNEFTSFYAGLDFESGTVGVFTEFAIADAHLKGYVKPLLTDTTLIGKEDGFLETLWEGFVGVFKFILKNQSTDTVATKVPIEGDLSEVGPKVFPTVLNIFKNAWIKAFTGSVDGNIEYKDAFKESEKYDKKEAKEERKEKRKKKREERKAEKDKE